MWFCFYFLYVCAFHCLGVVGIFSFCSIAFQFRSWHLSFLTVLLCVYWSRFLFCMTSSVVPWVLSRMYYIVGRMMLNVIFGIQSMVQLNIGT